jgi:hypothetical protein
VSALISKCFRSNCHPDAARIEVLALAEVRAESGAANESDPADVATHQEPILRISLSDENFSGKFFLDENFGTNTCGTKYFQRKSFWTNSF